MSGTWVDEVTAAYKRVWDGFTPDLQEMVRDVKVVSVERDSMNFGLYDPKLRTIYLYGRNIRMMPDPIFQLEMTVRHEFEHALGWWHTEASHMEMSGAWTSAWYGHSPLTIKLEDGTLVTLP